MKAIEVARFGGPEVLEPREVPDPVPGADELLVDVHAADTLWLETMVRSGDGVGDFTWFQDFRTAEAGHLDRLHAPSLKPQARLRSSGGATPPR